MRGGAKTKDKGMLRDIDELTVSVSGEDGECELHCRESVIRDDESCELTI